MREVNKIFEDSVLKIILKLQQLPLNQWTDTGNFEACNFITIINDIKFEIAREDLGSPFYLIVNEKESLFGYEKVKEIGDSLLKWKTELRIREKHEMIIGIANKLT